MFFEEGRANTNTLRQDVAVMLKRMQQREDDGGSFDGRGKRGADSEVPQRS